MTSHVHHNDIDDDNSSKKFNKSRRRSETVLTQHGTEFDRNFHRKLTQSNSSSSEPRPSTERESHPITEPDVSHVMRRSSIDERGDEEEDSVPQDEFDITPRPPEYNERPLSGKSRRRLDSRTERNSDTPDLHIDLQELRLDTAATEIIETEHPRYERPKSSKGRQRGERVQDTTRYSHANASTNQQPARELTDPAINSQKYKEETADNDHDSLCLTSSSEYEDTERESETKRAERPKSSKIRQRGELTQEDLLVDGGVAASHATPSVSDERINRGTDEAHHGRLERPKSGWDSNLRRRRVTVEPDANDDLDIDLEIIAFHSNDYVAACQVIDIGNTGKSSFGGGGGASGLPPKFDPPGWNSKISPFTPRAWNGETTKTSGHYGEGGGRDDNRLETLDRVTSFTRSDSRQMNGDDSSTDGSVASGRSDPEQMFPPAYKPATFSGYEYEEVRGKVLEKYRRASVVNSGGQMLPSVHQNTHNYLQHRTSQPQSNTFTNGRPVYSNQPPAETARRSGPIRLHKLEPTCRVTKHSLDKTIKPTKQNGTKLKELSNRQSKNVKDEVKPGHKLRPLVGKRAKALISGNDPNQRIPKEIVIPVVNEKTKNEISITLRPGVTEHDRQRDENYTTNRNVSKNTAPPPKYTARDAHPEQTAQFTGNKSYDFPALSNESVMERAYHPGGKSATVKNDTMPTKQNRSSSFGHQSTYHDSKAPKTQNSQHSRHENGIQTNGSIGNAPISERDEIEQNLSSVNAQQRSPQPEKLSAGISSKSTYRKTNELNDANESDGNEYVHNEVESNHNKHVESSYPIYNETRENEQNDETNFNLVGARDISRAQGSNTATDDLDTNNWAAYESLGEDPRVGDNARPWGRQSLADLWQETQKMC